MSSRITTLQFKPVNPTPFTSEELGSINEGQIILFNTWVSHHHALRDIANLISGSLQLRNVQKHSTQTYLGIFVSWIGDGMLANVASIRETSQIHNWYMSSIRQKHTLMLTLQTKISKKDKERMERKLLLESRKTAEGWTGQRGEKGRVRTDQVQQRRGERRDGGHAGVLAGLALDRRTTSNGNGKML